MRTDQQERMQALSAKLTTQVLSDADPDTWAGAGKLSRDMTRDERGDAYWSRKMAAASLSLLTKVESLLARAGYSTFDADDGEGSLDAEIARAEKEAAAMLKRVSKRTHAGS